MEPIRAIESVEIAPGVSVTVKELTVAEVRAWLLEGERVDACAKNANLDQVMDAMLVKDVNMQDIYRMSSLTPDAVKDMGYSAIVKVVEVCKRLNPPFFALKDMLEKAGAAHTILNAAQENQNKGANL